MQLLSTRTTSTEPKHHTSLWAPGREPADAAHSPRAAAEHAVVVFLKEKLVVVANRKIYNRYTKKKRESKDNANHQVKRRGLPAGRVVKHCLPRPAPGRSHTPWTN